MSSLSGEKVFISGATGFIGSNLLRRSLNQGADVYINMRKSSNPWRIRDVLKDVSITPVDIIDSLKIKESLRKIRPNIILHSAAYGTSAVQNDTRKIFKTNVGGTINLVQSCMDFSFDLFVNTGSSSEYGIKNAPMHESDILEPINDYGVSKAAGTLYCRSVAVNRNLPIATLRLFSPFGPFEHESRLIPSLILAALQKKKLKISSRSFVRDFIFIDDVLDAYESLLMMKNPSGKIFNIGSGEQRTIGEIADTIARLMGGEDECEIGLPQAWKNEPACWQADLSLAKSELKWKPKFTVEEGLSATINWFIINNEKYRYLGEIS
jgi:nucleoside-diphosphate-sugar epimerase